MLLSMISSSPKSQSKVGFRRRRKHHRIRHRLEQLIRRERLISRGRHLRPKEPLTLEQALHISGARHRILLVEAAMAGTQSPIMT